ncbi:MAG: sugar transferase [Lentisphaerae bacterium]|nr:sugar transferase [Lentisphaerota bacterium]MCP4103598.1 sugar transferase [Lentisphaerota bacterium]
MPKMKDESLEKLMDGLIERGRSGRNASVLLKVLLWNLTIAMSYFIKRAADLLLSFIMLLLLSPFFLLCAVIIKLGSQGPIIFKQIRVGKDGRHFEFYKFRSMRPDAESRKKELLEQNESSDGVIFKIQRDPRVTGFGRFMRKFSIDELPQLFNVMIGDMSLVGPRPPLPQEVAEYTLDERKRLHIKPGLTCIWQVSGRSDIPFKQQVELDKEYIHSRSLWKDLVILLKTIPAVITGKGAY